MQNTCTPVPVDWKDKGASPALPAAFLDGTVLEIDEPMKGATGEYPA